jgi:hypothetical protein
MWAGHVVRMERRILNKVLGSCFGGGRPVGRPHNSWEDVMQPTCPGFGIGRLQQEMRIGGRGLGRPCTKNRPKHHRRRRRKRFYYTIVCIIISFMDIGISYSLRMLCSICLLIETYAFFNSII